MTFGDGLYSPRSLTLDELRMRSSWDYPNNLVSERSGHFGSFRKIDEVLVLIRIRQDDDTGSCCLAELDIL